MTKINLTPLRTLGLGLGLCGVAVALILIDSKAETPLQAMPYCKASELALSFDEENGNFNGMSHSGTLLVLRNIGTKTCKVSRHPMMTFQDAHHQDLKIISRRVPGMNPGPVVLPVPVVPGAEVTGAMRWVSGDVYDGRNCLTPQFMTLSIVTDDLQSPFPEHLCAPQNKPPEYTLEFLKPDPVYHPEMP